MAVWLASALGLAGCSTHKASVPNTSIESFIGHYESGPKGSWFRPCGVEDTTHDWWVTLVARAAGQFDQLRTEHRIEDGTSYFVRWTAQIDTSGDIGPRGRGKPALLVHELLFIGPVTDLDCTGE
jgi:hypothetical protein